MIINCHCTICVIFLIKIIPRAFDDHKLLYRCPRKNWKHSTSLLTILYCLTFFFRFQLSSVRLFVWMFRFDVEHAKMLILDFFSFLTKQCVREWGYILYVSRYESRHLLLLCMIIFFFKCWKKNSIEFYVFFIDRWWHV